MNRSVKAMPNCAVRTDLNLLLECLKYQMNCPDAQKQAMLTIYNICQQKGEFAEHFHEMGGILFIYNLSKSSKHLEVKEAALFTLGGLAENSVFCQQVLCRMDVFTYMSHLLMEDCPLTMKRVAVYMVSVLVTCNKSGQIHAKATGCIDILLDLFRSSFPISSDDMRPAHITQLCQLWTSVSNALCGCVNNPQNEENQLMCMSIFPVAKTWLESFVLPVTEIMQPITSLVGMTVANNPSAQGFFASTGGLRTLAQSLVTFAAESSHNPLARELAAMMTKTLSLCITDNAPLASGLAEYHLVPQLVTLLSCPALDPRNRLCVVLAVGHCTDSCEEHQSQLLRAGGLPLMIQLLAESQDEELKRAATFVLQTCKQMTSTLGAFEASSPPQADPGGLQERVRPFCDMPSYWRSALEIKERIKQLEKLHREVDEGERDATNSTDKRRGLPGVETPLLTLDPTAGFWEGTGVQRTLCRGEERGLAHEGYKDPIESRELTPARPALQPYRHQKREGNSRSPVEYPTGPVKRQIFWASAAAETLTPPQSPLAGRQGDRGVGGGRPEPQRKARSSAPQPPGGASQPREPAEQGAAVCSVCSRMPDSSTPPATGGGRERDGEGGPPTAPPESQIIFRRPYPAKTTTEGQSRSSFKDHMSLCSDILEGEISRILQMPVAMSKQTSFRCSGCTLGLSPANSRTFTQILRSCRYRCDRHTVLMDAEDRFKTRVQETIRKEVHNSHWERCGQIRLTPMRKGSCLRNDSTDPLNKADPRWICLTPLKKARTLIDKNAYHREGATSKKRQETESRDEHTPNVSESREPMRRERKNFTQDEVRYLLDGVKKLGPSWNSILWSYPFQKGRTNVDLAKKFSRLQREIPHTQSLES